MQRLVLENNRNNLLNQRAVCYETRSFDTTSCAETTGTQPAEITTPLACCELRGFFDATSCA
jgi:hypothetical protein